MLPKVIDLFSGCGGLALGFEKAGFDIVAGVEIIPEACQTISYNLDFRYGKKQSHICGDITTIDPLCFKDTFGEEGCIVIGGPPCQAYSMAGKGKLRSLGKERVNTKDLRGYLYQDFLRFVYSLDAKVVIMENVPESTNFGEMNIPEIVCKSLESKGYDAYWTILNSADYGVPQVRERVIVFAKKSGKSTLNLPIPTHICPNQYSTVYQKRFESLQKNKYFKLPHLPSKNEKPWVTVGDAFSDLPKLFETPSSRYKSIKLNEEKDYKSYPKNEFQKQMRRWYNNETYGVSANAFRNTKRDFRIFNLMKQGDNYTAASKIADKLFLDEVKVLNYQQGSEEYQRLHNKRVPIYDREKFENKWKRLEEIKPSHTLVAHLSKDTYSHIHPTEPRGISVREAARLQSFPDDFYFNCSMGDAFKQIGNAVPPLLAYGVAKSVLHLYREE